MDCLLYRSVSLWWLTISYQCWHSSCCYALHKLEAFIETEGYLPLYLMLMTLAYFESTCLKKHTFPRKINEPQASRQWNMVWILFHCNAGGDFKCKQIQVCHSKNPPTLKGLNQHWRSNQRAWITVELSDKWFLNIFCSKIEKHCPPSNFAFTMPESSLIIPQGILWTYLTFTLLLKWCLCHPTPPP